MSSSEAIFSGMPNPVEVGSWQVYYGDDTARHQEFIAEGDEGFKASLIVINAMVRNLDPDGLDSVREPIDPQSHTFDSHQDTVTVGFHGNNGEGLYVRHRPPDKEDAEKLLGYVHQKACEITDPQEAALLIAAAIAQIHPFRDGNGRTSRMLYAMLSRGDQAIAELAEAMVNKAYHSYRLDRSMVNIGRAIPSAFLESTARQRLGDQATDQEIRAEAVRVLCDAFTDRSIIIGVDEMPNRQLAVQDMWLRDYIVHDSHNYISAPNRVVRDNLPIKRPEVTFPKKDNITWQEADAALLRTVEADWAGVLRLVKAQKGDAHIKIHGSTTNDSYMIDLAKQVAGGSAKTMFKLDAARVIALPNGQDSTTEAMRKWRAAMQEPGNLQILRNLGILSSDIRLVGAEFNGIRLPLMVATDFSQYKNGIVLEPKKSKASGLRYFDDAQEAFDVIKPAIDEVYDKLLPAGLALSRDSIHLILNPATGKARLFVYDSPGDLAESRFEQGGRTGILLQHQAMKIQDALLNCVPHAVMRQVEAPLFNLVTAYCDSIQPL